METQGSDAATEAFEAVRNEVALLRRAVERLAAERADVPDYAPTLGQIANNLTATAQRVDSLVKSPALSLTPALLAAQIVTAGQTARDYDRTLLHDAGASFERATRSLRGAMASARDAKAQNRWLAGIGIGGVVAGMTLWAGLAGVVARAVPESWLWPERLAARTLDRPLWDAGQRLMGTANPEGWQAVVAGNGIMRANKTALGGCRKAATKAHKPVRCRVDVGP